MSDVITIVAIAVGFPVAAISLIIMLFMFKGWWVKAKEIKLRQNQLELDVKRHNDEMTDRMLRGHTEKLNSNEIERMSTELLELRAEIADMKSRMNVTKNLTEQSTQDITQVNQRSMGQKE
jgi:hypothetical protein